MTTDEQYELLESIVALRVEADSCPERVRRSLAAVEKRLLSTLPHVTRKRIAARVLGVSVQSLDRWARSGDLPLRPISSGITHMGIPTAFLVDLGAELRRDASDASGRLRDGLTQVHEQRARNRSVQDAHNLITAVHALARGVRTAREEDDDVA
ncbi:MAG: hypothetical protein JWM25_532 [Thermoleophilia bacterium]|nr:hypothetical protein [Thermoleophilia bacterium]